MAESISLESAGAVVLAKTPTGPRLALLHRCQPNEWRLPKGKLRPGESHREAAQREVAEELGLEACIGEQIGETYYCYTHQGQAYRKRVVFFLARMGEPETLRPERRVFDEARWVSPAEALELLSWENEREMVRRGLQASIS